MGLSRNPSPDEFRAHIGVIMERFIVTGHELAGTFQAYPDQVKGRCFQIASEHLRNGWRPEELDCVNWESYVVDVGRQVQAIQHAMQSNWDD